VRVGPTGTPRIDVVGGEHVLAHSLPAPSPAPAPIAVASDGFTLIE